MVGIVVDVVASTGRVVEEETNIKIIYSSFIYIIPCAHLSGYEVIRCYLCSVVSESYFKDPLCIGYYTIDYHPKKVVNGSSSEGNAKKKRKVQ